MGDMFLPLKRFLDFSGRSRRREYWLFILLYSVVATVAIILDIQLGLVSYASYSDFGDGGMSMSFSAGFGPLTIAVMLLFLIPVLSVTVRRMHDVDKSGWFMLIPLYNFILTCIEGTRGPNRFGPDPKADTGP